MATKSTRAPFRTKKQLHRQKVLARRAWELVEALLEIYERQRTGYEGQSITAGLDGKVHVEKYPPTMLEMYLDKWEIEALAKKGHLDEKTGLLTDSGRSTAQKIIAGRGP